jgi:hypothetical protein
LVRVAVEYSGRPFDDDDDDETFDFGLTLLLDGLERLLAQD